MRTRMVDLGDVSLHVVDAGEGGRPVMLVHGFTATAAEVARVLRVHGWDGRPRPCSPGCPVRPD